MSNLDLFNLHAARLLAQLYDEFPIARGIEDVDIAFPPAARTGRLDDTPEVRHAAQVAQQTRLWLRDTGYLIERQQAGLNRYVLSPKALEVLNAAPASLAVKETLGRQLTKATKNAAAEGTKKLFADLIGQVIGSAMKSMSS